MAYADYEHCQGCDGKAIYSADIDVPDDVVVWHRRCLEDHIAARIGFTLATKRYEGAPGGGAT